MFPQSHLASVGQGIAAERLVGGLQRQYVVVPVGLLNPLHTHHRVGYQLVASLYEGLVLRPFIVRIVGVFLVEVVVVIYEVDWAERAVGLYFAHHSAYGVAVVGVVLGRYGHAVVANGDELARLRHVEAHALVHYGLQVLGHNARPCGLGEAVGHVVYGEQLYRLAPCVAVVRRLEHRLSRRLVLAARVGQVVHIELSVPVSHHRLVVIEPVAASAHGLYVVHSHYGRQSAVVACGRCHHAAGIVHGVAVFLDEVVHDFFRCYEHRAVLVAYGEADAARAVLEVHEVLSPCRAVDAVAVRVIVDVVPAVGHCRRRPLGEALRERLRGLAPRAVRRLGEGNFEVALLARVVLQHHHVVLVAALHERCVYATEVGVDEHLGLAELLEVFCRYVVEAVVVVVVFLIVGELARDARRPYYHVLAFHVVVEQFRRPDVHRRGVVHDVD